MKLDLAQVKSLFSNADFIRGMEYFRQGRVLDMTAGEGENPMVRCCVRGSEIYSVRFQQMEYGYMRIGCSCLPCIRACCCVGNTTGSPTEGIWN